MANKHIYIYIIPPFLAGRGGGGGGGGGWEVCCFGVVICILDKYEEEKVENTSPIVFLT